MLQLALEYVTRERELLRLNDIELTEKAHAKCIQRFYDFRGACERYLSFYEIELHPGRSEGARLRRSRLKYRPTPDVDCWLVLIWPVVTEYKWNFADVEFARRLKFHGESPGTFRLGSKAEREWIQTQRAIFRPDHNAIAQRCKRLGLELSESRRNRSDDVPEMLQLALEIAP
jgi:hypothetical protein